MTGQPPDERGDDKGSRKLQMRTFYIACAALAISVGHVVYAFSETTFLISGPGGIPVRFTGNQSNRQTGWVAYVAIRH